MRLLYIIVSLIFLFITGIWGAFLCLTLNKWVDLSQLEHYNPGKPSILLDDEGNEWGRFQLDRREPISLTAVPPHLIHAFLAAEDHRFFSHVGISLKGILRSFFINIYKRRIVQGASTITQQLVKLLFYDSQRTFKRKIKEQILALIVEQQCTKEQILETYINHIYFGCGIYGVQAACQRFWNCRIENTTIEQAATLAAIVRSPNRYCPLLNSEQAEARRNVILKSMYQLNYIDQKSYLKAKESLLTLTPPETKTYASHAQEWLRGILEELVGKKQLYTGGLTIQTSLNQPLQRLGKTLFDKHIQRLRIHLPPDLDGGMLSLEPHTGEIKMFIGGYDFKLSQFNRIFARRQMGSIFKPLIYATAAERGTDLTDIAVDEPLTFTIHNQTWSPRNAYNAFLGPMTLGYALSISNNTIAIKTLLNTKIDNVIAIAQACHLESPPRAYPSLALGCIEASVWQAAAMFNIFVNRGIYVEPHILLWIKDQLGNKIWKYTPVTNHVISWATSSRIASILQCTLQRLKKLTSYHIPQTIIGKTGTTNDARTCWFTGATPTLTTALYLGSDSNKALGKQVYASRIVYPLWADIMSNFINAQEEHTFLYDPSLTPTIVNGLTGKPISTPQEHPQITLLL
jgi:penicillin-binding protein 1A